MDHESGVEANDGQNVINVYQSYFRATRWSRIALLVFWAVVAVFVLWALPWDPFGMQPADYSIEVVLALVLLGIAPAVAAIGLLARSIAQERREALMAWSSIYDGSTGLRKSDYFMERLGLQCRLGKDLAGFRVGVILVKMEEPLPNGKGMGPPNDEVFRLVAGHLVEQMRPADLVAAIGVGEIAIMVSATSPVTLQLVTERVRRSVDSRLEQIGEGSGSKMMVQIGLGYFDQVNNGPELILARAREEAKVIRIDGHRVAA